MTAPRIRRWYERVGAPVEVFSVSRTKQEFVSESDVNVIIKRYQTTGMLPQRGGEPLFGDFSALPSYHEALNVVTQARESFASLPSAVRSRFENDPAQLLEFLQDEGNFDEAVRLGLVPPREAAPAAFGSGGDGGTPPSQAAAPEAPSGA